MPAASLEQRLEACLLELDQLPPVPDLADEGQGVAWLTNTHRQKMGTIDLD